MSIRQGLPERLETFDVCVVGSGPAGLAVALACEGQGLSVVVLEAGREGKASSVLDSVQIVDARSHAGIDTSTRVRFGGTSSVWGGLCTPYDPIDFEERPWVSAAAWPVAHAEIARWESEAGRFLDCGTAFLADGQEVAASGVLDVGHLGRLTRRASLSKVYRNRVATSRGLTLCLRSKTIDLVYDHVESKIVGVDVSTDGNTARVSARHVVLAAGGLRSTGLLLRLARAWPTHFARSESILGRYYMGHLTGEIATIVFRDPTQAAAYLYSRDAEQRWVQRRIKLSPSVQRTERLLNAAFTLRSPRLNEHGHRDGALSAISLLATVPGITRAIGSERLRNTVASMRPGDRRRHLNNILRHPTSTAINIGRTTYQCLFENLPVMTLNASGRYSLRYHAEQAPNPDSRVMLDDADGRNLLVDFRYLPCDVNSVLRSHCLLDEALRAEGLGYLEYHCSKADRSNAVQSQASDGYHQIGMARMSDDPRTGVVDTACCVHGLANLYLASAALFPTSGAANPTFTIVAMALRVADIIAHRVRRTPAVSGEAAHR